LKFESEYQLYPIIANYLQNKNYNVAYEVSVGKYHPRVFDIVAIKNNSIISIEVKLNNFKRTFQQAISRLFYNDKVYVAFPEEYIPVVEDRYLVLLKDSGIGLISVNDNIKFKLPAKKSTYLKGYRKMKLLDNFKEKINKSMEDNRLETFY